MKSAQEFDMNGDEVLTNTYETPSDNQAIKSLSHESESLSDSDYTDINFNDPDEKLVLEQALAFTALAAPPPYTPLRLGQPIAIPQLRPGIGQAFIRAYPPCLAADNISEQDFLSFIDNLNIVATASPSLQAVDLIGNIVSFVPNEWAMIAGMGVSAIAQVATAVVSKTRTIAYMKQVNETFFAPRGLQARIVKSDEMCTVLKLPPHAPLVAPLSPEVMQVSSQERRLMAIRPYSAELKTDVPPPAPQTTILAKLCAKQLKMKENAYEKKALRGRKKASKPIKERSEKKMIKEMEKREKKDKEAKKANKVVWILIENL